MEIDNIIEICVGIDIAILGIAYPIIVDKISNIGDKYSSNYLSVLFNYEFPQNYINLNEWKLKISIFKLTLFITIISFLFLIFKIPPPFGWDNFFINNSAKLIVLITTIFLTVFFFIWLDKVVLYNGKSTSLLQHIIKKYKSINKEKIDDNYWLKTINEFTYYAIDSQDEHLQQTLLEFYYSEFSNIRKKHKRDQPLIYPSDLYMLVYKLNFELANSQNKKLPAIEHRAVSGIWLLGEDFEEITISEETYSWIWKNLYVICDNDKFIKMYWARASQYFDMQLRNIYQEYDDAYEITNSVEIKEREQERSRFLEFHYALGGLLLYRNQYKTLKYIFHYSQSLPPKYVLLPENMTTIFFWFEEFRNEYKHILIPIDLKYYFPELDNLGNRRQVNYWICSYITVLFIRQYSLNKYYTFHDFISLPNLPANVVELNNWFDSVNFFEKCLEDTLANTKLIEDLEYTTIVANNETKFKKFISDLKAAIKEKIGMQKMNAVLSPIKVQTFNETTTDIIKRAFEQYKDIFIEYNSENSDEEDLKLTVTGTQTLMSKSAFTDDDIPHMNYESVVAEQIKYSSIEKYIPNSFFISRTRRYLLNRDNIIDGLDKLMNNKPNKIIVVVNLTYDFKQIINKYSNITKNIPSTEHRIQNLIFVLDRNDLPSLIHKELSGEEIAKNKLELVNGDLKLYTSIIDINQPENILIKETWNNEDNKDNLDIKVQISIAFLSLIIWKKNRDVVQISIASQYEEQGIQNSLTEIEPFEK